MDTVPKIITDMGLTAVSLFLFVSAIYLIYRIVQTIKGNKAAETPGNGVPSRTPCIQSPFVSHLISGQQVYLRAIDRVEQDTKEINTNVALLTQLMERVAAVQERLADCLPRQTGHK